MSVRQNILSPRLLYGFQANSVIAHIKNRRRKLTIQNTAIPVFSSRFFLISPKTYQNNIRVR
jgi:hypothetical protein